MKQFLFFWALFFATFSVAQVNVSPLFVQLSDAMEAVKKSEKIADAQTHLTALQTDFNQLDSRQSPAGQQVQAALTSALNQPNDRTLEALSKALYAFEKEQNPVDYAQKRQQFAKRVMPVYEKLLEAVKNQDLIAAQAEYKRFNSTWTLNEKVVRETSLGHYGQIETAMTLLRIAMLAEPANFAEMQTQALALGDSLADFKSGKVLQPKVVANAPTNLPDGIALLEKSYQAFSQGDLPAGQADIRLFIEQWAMFEGEVRTRDGGLYTRVEADLPVILVKGNELKNMANFRSLLDELAQLDVDGSYGVLDAMLILLREGVEALLIIMALLTTLNAANQPRAKRWIYTGAGLGLGASVLGAIALQQLFPAVSAGTNREILEGGIGILAVLMMIFIGAWLHSKSSIQGWKAFIDKHVNTALKTGSLLSMLGLSFLSVFREGAETILFYVGMLPLISLQDLLSGIGLALGLLVIIAVAMQKFSDKLPIHQLFKLMTWLIYALGFKILGISIHALQLQKILPTSLIDGVPTLPWLGFYANWQGILAQLAYLLSIWMVAKWLKRS